MSIIQDEIIQELVGISPPIFNNDMVYDAVISEATIEQLWTLHKWVVWKRPFKIISIVLGDHMALLYEGMYIAILPDGSAHS